MLLKICGLKRQEDVSAVARMGADLCGFIFHPRSPRFISPERAAELDSGPCRRVGVFVEQGGEEILRAVETARLDLIQLHGRQGTDCALRVGAERVIRVIWPERFETAGALQAEIDRHAGACALYLLDAGRRGGGSGTRLDWASLRSLRFPHPWLLAGGLDADNLAEAVAACAPDGVDVNSGAEDAPGVKGAARLDAVAAAWRAVRRDNNTNQAEER